MRREVRREGRELDGRYEMSNQDRCYPEDGEEEDGYKGSRSGGRHPGGGGVNQPSRPITTRSHELLRANPTDPIISPWGKGMG